MSRKGIEYASITLHPHGLPHGPQPGKAEESIGPKATDELAVMVDTFRPLHVSHGGAAALEDPEYLRSWLVAEEARCSVAARALLAATRRLRVDLFPAARALSDWPTTRHVTTARRGRSAALSRAPRPPVGRPRRPGARWASAAGDLGRMAVLLDGAREAARRALERKDRHRGGASSRPEGRRPSAMPSGAVELRGRGVRRDPAEVRRRLLSRPRASERPSRQVPHRRDRGRRIPRSEYVARASRCRHRGRRPVQVHRGAAPSGARSVPAHLRAGERAGPDVRIPQRHARGLGPAAGARPRHRPRRSCWRRTRQRSTSGMRPSTGKA